MGISMRLSFAILLTVVCASCETSQKTKPLTAQQAEMLAIQLANKEADKVFHRQPFEAKMPPHFEAGHWVWTGSRGAGLLDFQATVELAADGSTNSVDVKLLDDALRPARTRF